MFTRTQIFKTKKGVVNHNIIFPPGVLNDGYQATFHNCDDSGEVCQGRGENSIFNREFLWHTFLLVPLWFTEAAYDDD